MKNSKTIWLLGLAAMLLLGAAVLRINTSPKITNPSPSPKISLTYPCQPGKTALELLEQSASVEAKDSSFGKLVTGINGTSQGEGKYWLYTVDAKEATIGASAYNCIQNEEIRWELK